MRIPRPFKFVIVTLLSLAILAMAGLAFLWWVFTGSLAQLEGPVSAQAVSAPTFIRRDAQGLVTIEGDNREDIAYSLGFVHAQERFFQMDLLRRNSAGELSELFGDVGVEVDKRIRVHQFRKRAVIVQSRLNAQQLALLEAYTQGVNAGLAQLRNKPFEYYVLNTDPEPWRTEDSLLVVYSMYMDLQDEWGDTERSLAALYEFLPTDWVNYLVPMGGEWDATIDDGDTRFSAPLPQRPLADFQNHQVATNSTSTLDRPLPGSNNWSVSGALTRHGAAMVADDMHLGLDVPNIWFRASWLLPESARRITGATLPGTPLMIVGSTENIAWGFTNAYGDFSDIIRLQTNAETTEYLTPEGWQPFALDTEVVNVKGQASQQTTVKNTRWGPVIGEDYYGNALVLRWVAHDPGGINLNLIELEQAENVGQALDIATRTAIPGQNFNVGDRDGNIGWTLIGLLPKRFGYTSSLAERLPADWSTGNINWTGYMTPDAHPRIENPANNRLWTANARVVSGDSYKVMGDGLGALGARQQQIRDRLFARDTFTEADFLAIHLDDEAVFLSRWQALLVATLQAEESANDPGVIALSEAVQSWQGHASANSVAYLLVKRFRERVIDQSVGHLFRYVDSKVTDFWPRTVDNKVEYAVWQLINDRPPRHIPHPYDSWDAFLHAQALAVYSQYQENNEGLRQQTWGRHNQLSIQHPLSRALPFLSFLLDMEPVAMPGDTFMPRVQSPDFGASQRMAVAPGQEETGYFHMATGQSGHPLSPFYRAGHNDWVIGAPSPFLPGKDAYVLQLIPKP